MKKKILSIDDSKAIRFLLQTVFGKNYQVYTASDGYSAMNMLTQGNSPDLIIADPKLPDMKDWELIEFLLASGFYGDIPILVLSALDKNETHSKCKELGVEKYYLKPFNPVELVRTVDSFTSFKNRLQYN
ncbi:MAG: response regulator [Chitinophagaceae bacterium]